MALYFKPIKKKPPKDAEERKRSYTQDYSKNGNRQVGGEARLAALKKQQGVKKPPKPIPKLGMPDVNFAMRDVPEPGAGNPALEAKAAKAPVPGAAPFAKLKALQDAAKAKREALAAEEPEEGEMADRPSDDLLDEVFAINKETERSTPTGAQAKKRKLIITRSPILSPAEAAYLEEKAAEEEAPPEPEKAEDSPQLSLFAEEASRAEAKPKAEPKKLPVIKDTVTAYTADQLEQIADIMTLPGVVCNICPVNGSCPEFQPNTTCAFDKQLSGLSSRDLANTIPKMEVIADLQFSRGMRQYYKETRLGGGELDPNVTRQLEIAAQAAQRVHDLKNAAKGIGNSTISVTASASTPAQQGGGLLAALLGGVTGALGPPKPSASNVLELNADGEYAPKDLPAAGDNGKIH